MKKNIFIIVIAMMLVTICSINVKASEYVGVSENVLVDSSGMSTYDVDKPGASDVWNVTTKGKYSFAGQAENCNLYTNYWITGKKTYTVYVKNRHSTETLRVKAQSSGNIYSSITVSPGASKTYTFTVNSTSEKIYLKFLPESNFEGWIK